MMKLRQGERDRGGCWQLAKRISNLALETGKPKQL